MKEYISKQTLYKEVAKLEEMARRRYLDTPSDSPAKDRYMAQLNERTRLKQMVADAKPCKVREEIHGAWISHIGYCECNKCHRYFGGYFNFCPNCGADMRGEKIAEH